MLIQLPPKVKCPEPGCDNGRIYTGYANLNAAMLGKVNYHVCPRCNGEGEVSLDRDLIDAIVKAGLIPTMSYSQSKKYYRSRIIGPDGFILAVGKGPNSTAALLAAIQQVNDGHGAGKE